MGAGSLEMVQEEAWDRHRAGWGRLMVVSRRVEGCRVVEWVEDIGVVEEVKGDTVEGRANQSSSVLKPK